MTTSFTTDRSGGEPIGPASPAADHAREGLALDRFQRQLGLIDTKILRSTTVTVIGVGTIGRQLAIQLASLGVGTIRLIDFDQVELHNVTSQGFPMNAIGTLKVEAVAQSITQIDSSISLKVINDRFRPSMTNTGAVFCCVDSISTRAAIWKACQRSCEFWSDGRMLGEVIRVLTAISTDTESKRHYSSTLFRQEEAQTGSCTSRSTIYSASIAAGIMIHQFTRWLRGLPIDTDLQLNLLSSELAVAS